MIIAERNKRAEEVVAALPEEKRNIVHKHLQNRAEIAKLENLREFLVNEMHAKKYVMRRTLYAPINPETQRYYRTYLFLGGKGYSSFNVFPSSFKCHWEDIMVAELEHKKYPEWDLTHIYYDWSQPTFTIQKAAARFEEKEFALSPDTSLTGDDINILEKYRILLFRLFERGIAEIGHKNIIKEFIRIRKVFAEQGFSHISGRSEVSQVVSVHSEESDVYIRFIKEKVVRADSPHYLTATSMYIDEFNGFKRWFRLTYPNTITHPTPESKVFTKSIALAMEAMGIKKTGARWIGYRLHTPDAQAVAKLSTPEPEIPAKPTLPLPGSHIVDS